MKTKKILIVDDDISILNLLDVVLRKDGFINIFKAENGLDAFEIFYTHKPDLIILDVMLPDLDGNVICQKIRQSSMTPILFLSANSSTDDKLKSYLSGGDNYITKPFSPKEVIANISSILARAIYHESKVSKAQDLDILEFGDCLLDFRKKELYRNNENIILTSKEYYILEFLINNKDQTISRDKLIENIWDSYYDGYDNTVMVHIRRLREKIEVNPSKPLHIITVKGRGYRFEL